MTKHIVPVKTYATIWLVLLACTALTALVSFVDLGGDWNAVVAMCIAVFKASLVVLFFMHLRYSSRFTWVLATAGIFWLAILIGFTMADHITRPWTPSPPPWGTQNLP